MVRLGATKIIIMILTVINGTVSAAPVNSQVLDRQYNTNIICMRTQASRIGMKFNFLNWSLISISIKVCPNFKRTKLGIWKHRGNNPHQTDDRPSSHEIDRTR